MGWTEGKIDELTVLFEQGLSSGEIAKEMSLTFCEPFTRNAIMGKLNRLKLKRPPNPIPVQDAEPTTDQAAIDARSEAEQGVQIPRPGPADRRLADLPLVHLKPGQCKWPLGGWPEDTPVTFCRYRAFQDYPYCLEHCRISYGWD